MSKKRKKSKNKNKKIPKISGKLTIRTEITDEEGNIRTIEEEIDVNDEKTFSKMEKRTIEMGEKWTTIVLKEKLKKKKKWRLRRLWEKIKGMLRMGRKRLKLGGKHHWKNFSDKK